jgi:hypothetical protein
MSSQVAKVEVRAFVNKLTGADLADVTARLSQNIKLLLAAGTGSGQADQFWSDTRVLADGANETLDFIGGGLLDHQGNALVFAKIKAIIISTVGKGNTTTLLIGAAALPIPFFETSAGDRGICPVEGFWATGGDVGYALGAGATDQLKITNNAGAEASYDIIVIGTTA